MEFVQNISVLLHSLRLFLIRSTHYFLQLNQNFSEPDQRIRISNLGRFRFE